LHTPDYSIIASRKKSIKIFFSKNFFRALGEIEVVRATNVSLHIAQKIKAQSKKKKPPPSQKRVGLLIITNFRLCFVAFEEHDKTDKNNSNKVNFFAPFDDVTFLLSSFYFTRRELFRIKRTTFWGAMTSHCRTWTRSTRIPIKSTNW
jgi:hypothetical protein